MRSRLFFNSIAAESVLHTAASDIAKGSRFLSRINPKSSSNLHVGASLGSRASAKAAPDELGLHVLKLSGRFFI